MYKYSLNITGHQEEKERFRVELERLGYKFKDDGNRRGTLTLNLCTRGASLSYVKNGEYTYNSTANTRDFEINIDDPEMYKAALGIAAMRDDEEYHVGEYLYCTEDINRATSLSKGQLYRIKENYSVINFTDLTEGNFIMSFLRDKTRKATGNEILQWFTDKISTNMSSTNTVTGTSLQGVSTNGASIDQRSKGKRPKGYKLIKRYPNCIHKIGDYVPYTTGAYSEFPDNWEPVYSDPEINTLVGNNRITARIIGNKIEVRDVDISIGELRDLRNAIFNLNGRMLGPWAVHVLENERFFRVGCSSDNNLFSFNELDQLIQVYDEHNNK